MAKATVIPGPFALVSSGNVTQSYMLDGDDIQARADAAIYVAGIKPEPPKEWTHMEVTGAEFREVKSGPNKGKLNIIVPGTRRTVRVSRSEIQQFEISSLFSSCRAFGAR